MVVGGRIVLVMGGIRSGKSTFAESLIAAEPRVRYVATAQDHGGDAEWTARLAAHRERRPSHWLTEEIAAAAELASLISSADGADVLLVDDLGLWLANAPDTERDQAQDALMVALRRTAARVILVSPEVGLSVVPASTAGRQFADALGGANQKVAEVADSVAFVVAGQPIWLKRPGQTAAAGGQLDLASGQLSPAQGQESSAPSQAALAPGQAAMAQGQEPAQVQAPTASKPVNGATPTSPAARKRAARVAAVVAAGEQLVAATPREQPAATIVTPPAATENAVDLNAPLDLPLHNDETAAAASSRLPGLDLPGLAWGSVGRVVGFFGGAQETETPRPPRNVRVILLHGNHAGGIAAGSDPIAADRDGTATARGEGGLALLATRAGAGIQVITLPESQPVEDGDAATAEEVEANIQYGWQLADRAADEGTDAIVLAASGAGATAAATAAVCAANGTEAAGLLARIVGHDGFVDDTAWMIRCGTIRDALRRLRQGTRDTRSILRAVGGHDLAVAVGLLLGATARRTPVMIDGPVGAAAGMLARDFGGQVRQWLLLADTGTSLVTQSGADVLGLVPLLNLRLDLGEGIACLLVLPLVESALTLAAQTPVADTANRADASVSG